ncbi:MAG: HlyD family type I secretion periplasmic adaptor subunit [Pseudomonadota bacterium]
MNSKAPFFARSVIYVVILLISSGLVWASYAEIDEITRGEGKVIPATKTQSVQATESGVVKEIHVQLGQTIKKGDLIVRLDDTTTTSSLGETVARQMALSAKIARLETEEGGDFSTGFVCPPDILNRSPEICENEARLLAAKRVNYQTKLAVLEQRKIQRESELNETRAEVERLEGSLEISENELALLAPLARRQLVAKTEMIRTERAVNDVKGQLKLARESIIKLQGAVKEATLQVEELGLQSQQEALNEKTAALAELSVLNETVRGNVDRVARTDIRSPVDGVVNTLAINTIGSFVQPGTVIAEVVPTSDELLVEARIAPKDIAFIRQGQPALVKITAYDFSIYGGLDADVSTVTADSVVDQQTGEAFFQVIVKTDKSYVENNGKRYEITPGLISSVDIITGRKTILHYLLKPINKARQEALTER